MQRTSGKKSKSPIFSHCKSVYDIYTGDYDRSKVDGTEATLKVKRIISHPKYNRYTLAHNIALLELNEPVKRTNTIRTVRGMGGDGGPDFRFTCLWPLNLLSFHSIAIPSRVVRGGNCWCTTGLRNKYFWLAVRLQLLFVVYHRVFISDSSFQLNVHISFTL